MTIESITARYNAGRMTDALLAMYVRKGVVTSEQFKTITGKNYEGQLPSSEINQVMNIILGEEA